MKKTVKAIAIIVVLSGFACLGVFFLEDTSTNESDTVTALRSLASAQCTFKKKIWYKQLDEKCMANGVKDLYEIDAENSPGLIEKDLLDAFNGVPKNGYLFYDLSVNSAGKPVTAGDPGKDGAIIVGFVYLAKPAEYGVTGINLFVMNENGAVYGHDIGSKEATDAYNHYPNLDEEGWLDDG